MELTGGDLSSPERDREREAVRTDRGRCHTRGGKGTTTSGGNPQKTSGYPTNSRDGRHRKNGLKIFNQTCLQQRRGPDPQAPPPDALTETPWKRGSPDKGKDWLATSSSSLSRRSNESKSMSPPDVSEGA